MARRNKYKWSIGTVAVLLAGTAACTGGGGDADISTPTSPTGATRIEGLLRMILRKSLASLTVALLASTSAACGGGGDGKWTSPGKGQAAQLLDFSDGGRDAGSRNVAFYGFSNSPEGMTTGRDGSVYVLGQKLVKLKPDRTVSTVPFTMPKNGTAAGIVALPDGSLILGSDGQVKKIAPGGKVSVLAGASGTARTTGGAVPASADAANFHFSATPSPFGARPDGAILIADQDTLWSLKDGTLKRLYRITGKGSDGLPFQLGPDSTVDASGTAYVSPAERDTNAPGRLGDVLAVSAGGLLSKPLLPAKIAGLPGSPAALKVRWLTGDGANGIFVQVYDSSGNNGAVLHLLSGKTDLVAHENSGSNSNKPCRIQHPVEALHLPCPLPEAMTYRSGSLVLGGVEDYVLQIRLG